MKNVPKARTSSARPLTIAAIAVAAVLLGLWLRPRAIPVEAVTVSRGELVVALEEEGVTRIHPRTVVAAPAAGRFFPLPLREGDRLAAGQPVGWLVPAPLDSRSRAQAEAALGAARAALAEARAEVAEALVARDHSRRERERQEALGRAGHQAPSLVDDARAAELAADRAHEAAVARSAAAAQHVESARAALVTGEGAPPGSASRIAIVVPPPEGKPLPGGANLLLRRFEESERVLAAGAPLVELGRLEDLEVVVDVLTTDAPLVRPGAEMLVATGGPAPLRARVLRVEPSAFTKVSPLGVEEQRVNVIAALETVEPSLGDRFRVDVRIVVSRGGDVVKAPAGAVFRTGGGWGAFLLAGERARLVSVSIGRRNPDEVEVTGGLRPGDLVIAYPPDGLDDGDRVAPIPAARR